MESFIRISLSFCCECQQEIHYTLTHCQNELREGSPIFCFSRSTLSRTGLVRKHHIGLCHCQDTNFSELPVLLL